MSEIKKEGIIAKYTYRKISSKIARFLASKTRITPNQVTAIRLILTFIAIPFLSLGERFYFQIGGVIVTLAFILDYVDGDLARQQNSTSMKGKFFDVVFDRLSIILSISSMSVGLFRNTMNPFNLFHGAIVISLFYLSDIIDVWLDKTFANSLQGIYRSEIDVFNKLLGRFRVSNVYYFGEDSYYSLIIIGCIFNATHVIFSLLTIGFSVSLTISLFKVAKS